MERRGEVEGQGEAESGNTLRLQSQLYKCHFISPSLWFTNLPLWAYSGSTVETTGEVS